ncbi:P-loop NTPase family protein [Anabaena azotica]|uniref:CobQ/CobB/MinD/ParA nucleotide binding domain-containing protein n=1 Tax=Anabaena azotica FACHB-119 TaxID=947527 RepID=A0ABR8DCP2_9NOST|nr:hypothetical protein [Anabaena azotica]MBD2505005.1 hypothetical protein [Anabaena azotica FACHB-119]
MTCTTENNQNGKGASGDIQAIELTKVEEVEVEIEKVPQQNLDLQKTAENTDTKPVDVAPVPDKEIEEVDNKAQVITKSLPIRFVVVHGGKGGTGKSMWTRGVLQTCIDAKRKIVAVDADNTNPDLLRYYGESGEHFQIQKLNVFKDGSMDRFFDQIRKMIEPQLDTYNQPSPSPSLFLLELPPQSSQVFKKFIEQGFLETAANDYNIRVTIVVVISRVSDSVKQLIDLYSYCGDKVDYIVVKNLFYGEEEEFSRYNNSPIIEQIKQKLLASGTPISEVTMPDLLEYVYDYLDEKSLPFSEGIKQTELPGVKMRVRTWLKTFKQQIEPVKHLLGLESMNVEN